MIKYMAAASLLFLLTSCSSLERLDYVCVDVIATGPMTGTRADGKGIKIPEGETLTPELAAILCGDR
jgi:hypothetical protein